MAYLKQLYRTSLFLLTDLYQLTMAQAYWRAGMVEHEGVFHLFFRRAPFKSGYTVAAGLGPVVELLEDWSLSVEDRAYLAGLTDSEGNALFDPGFLSYLAETQWRFDLDAVREGTVVFPHEPVMRVRGPLIACQLLETALLNMVNFSTLIATKAARVCAAAGEDPVLEFGLRRAQGPDGAVMAARAAHIGGCTATSNVLAGRLLNIPVKGTHAHSWVMCFDDEQDAFRTYAEAMPGNCTFLVDTYDTLDGVRNAIEVGKWLKEQGHRLLGVRLDSGDLAWLSTEARRLLDEAGFHDTVIVASNDLDEHLIETLKVHGAPIAAWGVGTQLVTGGDQAALGGVYKLGATRAPGQEWQPRIKLSEQLVKISTPGTLQVRRFVANGIAIGDAIFDENHATHQRFTIIDPVDPTRRKRLPVGVEAVDLLEPVFRDGVLVAEQPTLAEIRGRVKAQLALFDPSIRRVVNPHPYPAGLESQLYERKMELILDARERTSGSPKGEYA